MAPKVSSHTAVQCSFRRHHKQQAFLPTIRIKSRKAIRLNLAKSVSRETRRLQQHEGVQIPVQDASASDPHHAAVTASRATASGGPDQDHILAKEDRLSSTDEDTAAADILRALYFSGILTKSTPGSPASQSCADETDEVDGLPTHKIIRGANLKPSEVALPGMQQTDFILHSWRAEDEEEETSQDSPSSTRSSSRDIEVVDVDMDAEPRIVATPELSPSLSHSQCSLTSSSSSDGHSQADPLSPVTPYLRIPSPNGPLPPAYTEWNSKNCSPHDGGRPVLSFVHRHDQTGYFPPFHYGDHGHHRIHNHNHNHHHRTPSSSGPSTSGMISPPQSPVYRIDRLNESCYFNTASSPLSPPAGYPGFALSRQQPPSEKVNTTIVTLPPPPPPSAGLARAEQPLTPVSPFNSHSQSSPQSEKRTKALASTSSTKKPRMPRPHCNVKYETAELDFIMYQRTTKNRAWDDVTASFNAALPRLRQYAEMDYMKLGSGDATAAAMDRYRPRPERTTPGLQASYYRQRLALPLLDENGQLVFDPQTNKQMFTEVMVRDDKSRKQQQQQRARRMSSISAASGKPANCTSTNPDDARVHLVLYFPERVAHYDYWFVSAEDKELARQRAYDRNMQRARRGLPPWEPGSDDPETGILIRNKE